MKRAPRRKSAPVPKPEAASKVKPHGSKEVIKGKRDTAAFWRWRDLQRPAIELVFAWHAALAWERSRKHTHKQPKPN